MSSQKLKQAYELIKAKKKQEAIDILLPILKFDDKNADAWWLMANALDDPDEIREALEKVLRLRPVDDKARRMLDNLNLRYPPTRSKNDDEFTFDNNPFEVIDTPDDYQSSVYRKGVKAVPLNESGKVVVTKSNTRTSPWVIILAVVGVLGLLGCVICLALPLAGISIFVPVLEQVVNDPTFQAALENMPEMVTTVAAMSEASQTLPSDVRMRGTIEPGQTVRGSVDTFKDDGWTFNGSQGRLTTIELTGQGDLDPQLYLYNADRQLIAENDDIEFMENNNSRIEISLPYSGNYTIVVSAFGSGGNYDLTVR
jgi:hypothetical protein